MWLGIAVFLLIVSLILVVLFFKYQENVLKIISLVGLLISAISFLFSVISANQNQSVNNDISHNTEVQTEATSTEAEVKDDNYSTEDQDENEEYDVMGSGDSSGENEWTNAFSDESEETQKESVDEAEEPYSEGSKDALEIAPIIYSACTAEVIEDMFFEVQPVNIIELPDEITNVGQSKEYEYIPSISGMHRFEFSDVPNGTDFNITILNSGWEQLKKEYNLDNGGGLTYSLTAGETYHIRVEQYRGVGSYKLNIGPKKQIMDITNYTAVSDSIQYTNQENDYLYLAENDGVHRFEFSDVPNGTDLNMVIYNSGWEQLKKEYNLDNGGGLTYSLTAGETYYIRVEQYRGVGAYTLNIGPKKQIMDITNYTAVSDSIQYTAQRNDYLYVAENGGVHRFEFSDVPNGTDLNMIIYNSGWEQLKKEYNLDNGGGLTYSLTAGETYYIEVEQYRGVGVYTLNIGPKKQIMDITNDMAVSDSIQYTAQENDYLYVAETDGVYRLQFSDVQEGNGLRLEVFNSGWEIIRQEYNFGNGDGMNLSLSKGERYFIRVAQHRGLSKYTLTVEPQQE